MNEQKRLEKVADFCCDLTKAGYELLSPYDGRNHTKITVRHRVCGTERTTEARRVLEKGCPCCSLKQKAFSRALPGILKIERDYDCTADASTYRGYKKAMRWTCNKCGAEVWRSPEDIRLRTGFQCGMKAHGNINPKEKEIKDALEEIKKNEQIRQHIQKMRREVAVLCADYEANGYEVLSIDKDGAGAVLKHIPCGQIRHIPRRTLSGHWGCMDCARRGHSYGADMVRSILDASGLTYREEVSFDDLKRERPLRFDFVIYNESMIPIIAIEQDGELHNKIPEFFGGDEKLALMNEREEIKREWCEKHNVLFLKVGNQAGDTLLGDAIATVG